jgi:hypothetical protein
LGDVIGVDDLFPNPPREPGATIRTATTVPGSRFEKEFLAICPELSGVVFRDDNCCWQEVA